MTETGWIEHLASRIEAVLGDPERPYRRPGSHLLLTEEQWELYDRFAALKARERSQFGGAAGQLSGYSHLGPAFGGVGLSRGRLMLS